MPVDASIYNAFAPRVQSVSDIQAGLTQNALARGQLQQNQLAVQQAQNVAQQRNALSQAVQSGQIDLSDPTHAPKALALAPDVAPAMLKTIQEGQEKASKIKLEGSQMRGHDQDTSTKALEQFRSVLPMVRTPEQFGQWVDGLYRNPATAQIAQQFGSPDEVKARIPQDPAQFQEFLKMNAMGMDKFVQDQTSKANNAANNATSVANNTATNKTHIQTAGIAAATSRANNADTIKKDYKVAGIDPQTGNFVGGEGSGGSLVDLVGTGKMPMSTALSRMPPGQKERFSADLQTRYPNYDPTALATQTAAAKAFTTGKEGALLRSIGTANKHLDMLDGLVGALDNGNVQVVNQAKNAFKSQFGSEAPSNFDAAKDIVGQEVVKAIVANGGSMQERTEAAQTISKTKSPDQLRGVIKTYKTIMSAQHESLLQQRDAAGLPRSTLPDYTEAKPATSGKTVTRTGTDSNGKKVIQYSDGSIEHAN